jgi:hypothetical protein
MFFLILFKTNDSFSYVKKELSKSTLSENDIKKILENNIVIKNLEEAIEEIKYIFEESENNYYIMDRVFMAISAFFMDLYQLTRIFKIFNDNSEPENVITYTGEAHSKFLRSALDTLGFELIQSEETSIEERCIDVSNFDPFFSNKL